VQTFELLKNVDAKEVSCESISTQSSYYGVQNVKVCFMEGTTVIGEDNVNIASPDESMTGMSFIYNRKIAFSPIRLFETFPNLKVYSTGACAIKKISKKNFAGLKKLIFIDLSNNQIEIIYSRTFEDLVSLERINLGEKNKFNFGF
jgi:Leucine rich repeat